MRSMGFPGSSASKEFTYNAGDPGWEFLLEKGQVTDSAFLGFPGGSAGKESTRNAGDLGSIPGLGRSPGEGKGYPLQDSDLESKQEDLRMMKMTCGCVQITND